MMRRNPNVQSKTPLQINILPISRIESRNKETEKFAASAVEGPSQEYEVTKRAAAMERNMRNPIPLKSGTQLGSRKRGSGVTFGGMKILRKEAIKR